MRKPLSKDELKLVFTVRSPKKPKPCRTQMRLLSRSLLTSDDDGGKTSNTIVSRILSKVKQLPSQFHDKTELIGRISRSARRLPIGASVMHVSLRPVNETECYCRCFVLFEDVTPIAAAAVEEDQICSICLEGILDVGLEGGTQGKHDYLYEELLLDAPLAERTQTVRANGCSHVFHRHCLSKWFAKAVSCPLCRFRPIAF